MSEKRRTWKKREYDRKLENLHDNESADILSFNFTSLEKERAKRKAQQAKMEKRERNERGDRKERKGDFKGKKPFKKRESRADRQENRKKFFGTEE